MRAEGVIWWRMADGEWRKDDLIRFLYATLGDDFAFLKLKLD